MIKLVQTETRNRKLGTLHKLNKNNCNTKIKNEHAHKRNTHVHLHHPDRHHVPSKQ